MTGDSRRLTDYLAHIVEAIDRIDRYTRDLDEPAFLKNQLVQDAVVRNLEPAALDSWRCGNSRRALLSPQLPRMATTFKSAPTLRAAESVTG